MSSGAQNGHGACSCESAAQRMIDEIAYTFTLPAKRLVDIASQLRDLPYNSETFDKKEVQLQQLAQAWDNMAKDFISKGDILYVEATHTWPINTTDQSTANRIHTQE